MGTVYTGQIFLIDSDFKRAENFRKKLDVLNKSVFFNYYFSVKEAFSMVLNDNLIPPEFIYVHASLANFEAKNILKKLRQINKTRYTKVIVFGEEITDALKAASVKYDFIIITTYPDNNKMQCSLFNTRLIGHNYVMVCTPGCRCC